MSANGDETVGTEEVTKPKEEVSPPLMEQPKPEHKEPEEKKEAAPEAKKEQQNGEDKKDEQQNGEAKKEQQNGEVKKEQQNGEVKKEQKNGEVKKEQENGEEKKPEENGTEKKLIGFKERFRQFSKFGDTKSDGKMITLSQSDKWMKQAKVIDKKITTTDTGIHFKKCKQQKISLSDYEKFLEDLVKTKKIELDEVKKKMIECGAPGHTSQPSGAAKSSPSAIERLTDVTKYTGSHKQRFDEAGKGRGIAGRKDVADKSGYVHGYQNKDSYNKTH